MFLNNSTKFPRIIEWNYQIDGSWLDNKKFITQKETSMNYKCHYLLFIEENIKFALAWQIYYASPKKKTHIEMLHKL